MGASCVARQAVLITLTGLLFLGLTEASCATDLLVTGNDVAIDVYDAYFSYNDGLGMNANPAGGVWVKQEGGIRKKVMLDDIAKIDIQDIYFDRAKNETFRECRFTTVNGAVHECSDIMIGYIHGTDIEGNKFSFGLATLWEEKGLDHLAIIMKETRTRISPTPSGSGRMVLRLVADGVNIDVFDGYFFYNDRLGRNSNPPGGVWVVQDGAIRKKLMLDDIARIDIEDIYFDRAKNETFRPCRVTAVSGAVHICSDINIGYISGTDAEGNKLSLGLATLWSEKGLQSMSIFVDKRGRGVERALPN